AGGGAAAGGASAPGGQPSATGSTARVEDSGSMFERLLGQAPSEQPRVRVGGQQVDVSQLIERLVQPFVVPDAPADQATLVQSVDAALAAQMRELLHDAGFQSLESAWRGLWWLVTNVETSDEIKLAMFDVSRDELAADLTAAQADLTRSGLYQALVERGVRTPGGQAWSLVAGLYTFGGSAEDLTTLAGLGRVCSQAGGAFVAAADSVLLGCRSLVDTPEPANWQPDDATARRWQTLRHSAVARHLGLILPRFLLRLPYGAASDEIEQFAFEELDDRRLHEHLLWGNPALVAAQLLAAAFAESGWQMQPGDVLDIIDLPAFIYAQDGQKKMQACAEVYLSERVGDAILRQGLMPLLSYQNRNAARLMRFQSVADPASGLAVGQP
ncbi:MAG: type VI secretion system contractile sheath large subunit, partial [Pirellulaceae bacterium]|nr:type VI secretion system contractile sheath large subunit [Pirellulaceae bacterium]